MGSLWSQKLRKLTNSPRTKETWKSRVGEEDTCLSLLLERLSTPTGQGHLSLNRTWEPAPQGAPAPPSVRAGRARCCVEREAAATAWGTARAPGTRQLNSHPEITCFWGQAARQLWGSPQMDSLIATNAQAGAAIAGLRVHWPYEGTNSEEATTLVAWLTPDSFSVEEGICHSDSVLPTGLD